MTQLINAGIPIPQSRPHAIDLLHIEHLRLNPVDPSDLSNLVDGSLQQTQTKRLHNQMLDLIGLDLGLLGDRGECHGAVVWGTTEDSLSQGGERDLLVEEDLVLFEKLVLGDVDGQDVVGGQVATVEGEEEVAQPGVGCFGEGIEHWVQKEFTEVVD